jgi:PD-(D/E)XK nuclease superfamily protein
VATPPARTLGDLLDGLAPTAADRDAGDRDAGDLVAELHARLDAAAVAATGTGGWTPDDPLRLSKTVVTWLLRCPRRALAAEAERSAGTDLVAGLVVDAAAKLATLVPQRPPTLAGALDYLDATGDTVARDHLADLGSGAPALAADLGAHVDRLAAAWPRDIDARWWPRIEEPLRVRLAGGAVALGGRLDLLLGGPPTDLPAVVVEVKGGTWYDGMRADGHLYALLVALRDGCPPAAVVTVVADGTTHVEPVRPAVLATAADRIGEALRVAGSLAAGEPPETRPGGHCGHCPVRPDCPPGRAWRSDER